ncbi:hypothetical protein ESA94_06680 [Lacibacter luteus]|uniref:Uncharacterized protein n=1 Tax=Lacibacter luteus TaxID=2508719 RepID=A0A4Q1CNH2_9BACT|nr:hypothetical protein [Lacibacter luteus]RXK62677.1 hypothetical protein ESA94_06680 [Lacibacter luteus]
MKLQIICILGFLLYSFNSLFGQTNQYVCKDYLSDTLSVVILPFTTARNPFATKFKPAIRPKIDYCLIEELLTKAIHTIYKDHLLSKRTMWIEEIMTSYKKLLIFATDNNAQSFVWINCLCKTQGDYWRSHIPLIFDGGPCYFNLKLNLTTREYFDFSINSQG